MPDTLLGGIVINEILVDPNGALNFDTDGNGTAAATDEYVELFNTSSSAIDISGLELWDEGNDNWFTFPPGTVLQPGAHAMVMTGLQPGGSLPTGGANDLFFEAGRNTALINNGGDNVVLYDPANDEFVQAYYSGAGLDDPTAGSGYTGFSPTATRVGSGENFGNDTDGESLQRAGDGSDTVTSGGPTPGATNICFSNGTYLATPDGDLPVERLGVGDTVLTADHGYQQIVWVFQKTWTVEEVEKSPNLAAVLIRRDALGPNLPSSDLRVSRQHRVLIQGAIAQRMFGAKEVLVPAVALLSLPGVSCEKPKADVTYFHIMLSRHEVVFSNGIPTESLYLGPQAIRSIPNDAVDEIRMILGLPQTETRFAFVPARRLVRGKRAADLIERHAKNRRALLDPMAGSWRATQTTQALTR